MIDQNRHDLDGTTARQLTQEKDKIPRVSYERAPPTASLISGDWRWSICDSSPWSLRLFTYPGTNLRIDATPDEPHNRGRRVMYKIDPIPTI